MKCEKALIKKKCDEVMDADVMDVGPCEGGTVSTEASDPAKNVPAALHIIDGPEHFHVRNVDATDIDSDDERPSIRHNRDPTSHKQNDNSTNIRREQEPLTPNRTSEHTKDANLEVVTLDPSQENVQVAVETKSDEIDFFDKVVEIAPCERTVGTEASDPVKPPMLRIDRPGAFHVLNDDIADNGDDKEKESTIHSSGTKSQKQIQSITGMRLEQEARKLGRAVNTNEPTEVSAIDAVTLDCLQENMQAYNVEIISQESDEKLAKRRPFFYAFVALLLLAGVACVVGIVVSEKRKDKNATNIILSPSAAPSEMLNTKDVSACAYGNGQESARFIDLSTILEAEIPEFSNSFMESGSVMRAALCWMSNGDTTLEWQVNDINPSDHMVQRFALVSLYYHFVGVDLDIANGLSNSNWLSSHECSWEFVECSKDSDAVEALKLGSLGLSGSIPSSVSLLTNLKHFDLEPNLNMGGTIPDELWTLTNLQSLKLGAIGLSGTISSSITNLQYLESFLLASTAITGEIPSLSELPMLKSVEIYSNPFVTGTFPDIRGLNQLELLAVMTLPITGTLPPSAFDGLPNLTSLIINYCDFTGAIPTEIGLLTKLEVLALEGARVFGSIPTEVGALELLEMFSVAGSFFTGSLPSELGRLSNLEYLNLTGAQRLEGSIPSEVCTLHESNGQFPNIRAVCGLACNCCAECTDPFYGGSTLCPVEDPCYGPTEDQEGF